MKYIRQRTEERGRKDFIPLNRPHKRVTTTCPVAIKHGQGRLHVPDPIPWHVHDEHVKCPDCDTIYILTSRFPKVLFFETLSKQHQNKEDHPDFIPSAPESTKVSDCDCDW
jgi:hypothetical protein